MKKKCKDENIKKKHSLNYISIFCEEDFQRKRKPLMKGILGM